MNRTVIALIVCATVIGATLIGTYVGFYNDAVKLENGVKAQFQSNKNTYDAFWKKVTEVAQVPGQYKEDFKDVILGNTEARYGEDGSKAQMQWITEHAVDFDSSMYRKVQTVIESGREDFKQSQDDLLDKQRVYATHLQTFTGSMLAGFAGFPKAFPEKAKLAPTDDLDGDGFLTVLDYKIVLSKKTNAAFATGEDEEIDVFGKKK